MRLLHPRAGLRTPQRASPLPPTAPEPTHDCHCRIPGWWPTDYSAAAPAGDNFLVALAPDSMDGVRLERIIVAGQAVHRHADWAMNVSGRVANVSYS